MVDRVTVYSGELPRSQDFLQAQQSAMVGIAKNSETILGTATLVDGFTCTPTTPASLNVLLTPGTIYQQENLEATTWSALGTDSHTIVKQGIQLDNVTFGITPPGTVGFSQVFLVEVQYQDSDTGSTVLPYYNAANPASPYSGPGNAGTPQNTMRKGVVASQVKAGIAAATGTQVAPTADAGWTGLFTVTVANGATTITSGNIATLSTAPFLQANGKLPLIPTGVQRGDWVYAADTGSANALVVTLSPAPASYVAGMHIRVKVLNTNTGSSTINVNGLGTKNIVDPDGTASSPGSLLAGAVVPLIYNGTAFQILGPNLKPVVNNIMANRTVVALTTPGVSSWSIPAGVSSLEFFIWGGGGGGGYNGTGGTNCAPGGGGSGAFAHGHFNVVSGLGSVSYTVGSAGAAGVNGSPATSGTSSSVTYNSVTITAGGGLGGTDGSVGTVSTSGGGGAVTNGDYLSCHGAQGGIGAINNGGVGQGGFGATAPGLGGGPGGAGGQGGTGAGTQPGGGGGASSLTAQNGGAGGAGAIYIVY